MVSVRVVEAAAYLVVDVVAVGHGQVPAGAVVPLLALDGCADGGAAAVDLEAMLVDMLAVWCVKVAVVKVIRMVAVAHGLVPAFGAVSVGVAGVLSAIHLIPSSLSARTKSNGMIHG